MGTMTPETVTSELTITELIPYEDTDDGNNHLTHIVSPPENVHIWQPGMEAQDVVDLARVIREEIVALCGYKFVPERNPEKYDACSACMKIAEHIMNSQGE